jgi:hypothetical protein
LVPTKKPSSVSSTAECPGIMRMGRSPSISKVLIFAGFRLLALEGAVGKVTAPIE